MNYFSFQFSSTILDGKRILLTSQSHSFLSKEKQVLKFGRCFDILTIIVEVKFLTKFIARIFLTALKLLKFYSFWSFRRLIFFLVIVVKNLKKKSEKTFKKCFDMANFELAVFPLQILSVFFTSNNLTYFKYHVIYKCLDTYSVFYYYLRVLYSFFVFFCWL